MAAEAELGDVGAIILQRLPPEPAGRPAIPGRAAHEMSIACMHTSMLGSTANPAVGRPTGGFRMVLLRRPRTPVTLASVQSTKGVWVPLANAVRSSWQH